MEGLPQPKRPLMPGWIPRGRVRLPHLPGQTADGWLNRRAQLGVLSSVHVAEQNPPGSGVLAPHYHVSVVALPGVDPTPGNIRRSMAGGRCVATDQELELVRAAFGMGGAEEDNHGEGVARHLWLLCGRDREPECPCKQDEQRTVEGDRVRHDTAEDLANEAPRG